MSHVSQVGFRVDASLEIGTGHVMRCLAFAHALCERGAACHFVCRDLPGHLGERIVGEGHTLHMLPVPEAGWSEDSGLAHASWLGAGWKEDAMQTGERLRDVRLDWLIIDHYALDARWERVLRPLAGRILVIDDVADREHDCDILLDQNLGRTRRDYAGLVPETCEVLVGPRHALLRPEFAGLRDCSLQRSRGAELKHVLVSMGGVDARDATSAVLRGIADSQLPVDCRITVVMGSQAPWISSVREALAASARPGEVLVDVRDMARLMAGCDLAIGAGGSTCWERCALGVPAILFTLADNQISSTRALDGCGAAIFAGQAPGIQRVLPDAVATLMTGSTLELMSAAAAAVTDGRGCRRIASLIGMQGRQDTGVTVRAMTDGDLEVVRRWRNHPDVRANLYSRHDIGAEEHRQWFLRSTVDQRKHLLVAERRGEPLGFVQFHEAASAVAEWGFYVAPGSPKGSGTEVCAAALAYAFRELGLYKVNGQALATNVKSAGLHRKLGFTTEGTLRKQHFDREGYVDVLCFGLLSSEFMQAE